jgi:SAM-dependent methyltransferase
LFLIYRPLDLPDPLRTIGAVRNKAARRGLSGVHLLGVNAHRPGDCRELGCDGTLDFEPQLGVMPGAFDEGLKIYDYGAARRRMVRVQSFPVVPSIFVGWDSTPRRGEDGIVFVNSTPERFEAGLEEIVAATESRPYDERLVFINAWNEWAEGNHLEPDRRHGLAYLEAVERVVMGSSTVERGVARDHNGTDAETLTSVTDVARRSNGAAESTIVHRVDVPAPWRELATLNDTDWLNVLIGTNRHSSFEGIALGEMPSEDTQRRFNTVIGEAGLREAFEIYRVMQDCIARWSGTLPRDAAVLDFGCGWGRITRCFLRDVLPQNLYGVDTDAIAIASCEQTMPHGTYAEIGSHPPIKFPSDSFDVIYAYSVFSHLPRSLHLAWVRELARILKPGGLFMASTLRRPFIDACQRLRSQQTHQYEWERDLAEAFVDCEAAIEDYDAGRFVFAASPRPDYGLAVVPATFVDREWPQFLELCDFIDDDDVCASRLAHQALIVAKKPSASRE